VILVNGERTTQIHVADRGLAYGDGVFETLAVQQGEPAYWDRHMQRLASGCERLGLPVPDAAALRADATRIFGIEDRLVLKILVTRGAGGRGYTPPQEVECNQILMTSPWPEVYDEYARTGIEVGVCKTRMGRNPALAGLKHLNRLEQVLASRELASEGLVEGLMLDEHGNVIEGTRTNLFAVKNGVFQTPQLRYCGVAGVMRAVILDELQAAGIPWVESDLALDEVLGADEIFMCNSIAGIWPVTRISGEKPRALAIGPETRALQDRLTGGMVK
jgi:4-amino-4-deoxychorismate lyase